MTQRLVGSGVDLVMSNALSMLAYQARARRRVIEGSDDRSYGLFDSRPGKRWIMSFLLRHGYEISEDTSDDWPSEDNPGGLFMPPGETPKWLQKVNFWHDVPEEL